jgi:hypothetical protein
MSKRPRRRGMPVLLGLAAVGLVAAMAGTAMAGTSGPSLTARLGGQVPGLTGAAAQQAAGQAADRFRALTAERIRQQASQSSLTDAAPATDLHTAWGVFFNDRASTGLLATHSVSTVTTHGGDVIYAPTALPPGGACTEMTTAYTSSGPLLWAWDWCGGRDSIGKVVNMDATFLSTYTTPVNGQPAYTMREVQTSTSTNAWTVYLFNYRTQAWDTFYATSGTKDIPGSTWDFFEIYTTLNPLTGAGYYCGDANGKAFEASSIQVSQNGTWTAANTSNSSLSNPPSGTSFDCPALAFSTIHANDHWIGRIGSTPPTSAPPSTSPPRTSAPSSPPPASTSPTGGGACTASYSQVNSWQGGFQGNVTVKAGNAAINSWTVKATFSNGASITQLWNGVLSGSAPSYTVKNQTYNGSLSANASTTFGFLASGTAAAPALSCTTP